MADNNDKKPSIFRSILLTALLLGLAFCVPHYIPAVPVYASYGIAVFLIWATCPHTRAFAGRVCLPVLATVLFVLSMPGLSSQFSKLPSYEELTANLPEISMPEVRWPNESETNETSSSSNSSVELSANAAGESRPAEVPEVEASSANNVVTVTPGYQQDSSDATFFLPRKRPASTLRPEVDTAVEADKLLLAVFQKTDHWGSWLSYSVWCKSLGLEPQEQEWYGLRNGFPPVATDLATMEARRGELLALGDVYLKEDGYPAGRNDQATQLINATYKQYVDEVKTR